VGAGFRKKIMLQQKGERDDESKKSHFAPAAVIILDVIALYVLAGAVTALAFVTFGISRVLPFGTPVTLGARVLLVPGAVILWPCVLRRWVKAGPP
jgi:hypothetical protein